MEGISIGIEAGFGTCRSELTARLAFAHSGIRSGGERFHCLEEVVRLADEQPAGSEPLNSSHRAGELIRQRTDRGATRKIRTNELGRNREESDWVG